MGDKITRIIGAAVIGIITMLILLSMDAPKWGAFLGFVVSYGTAYYGK